MAGYKDGMSREHTGIPFRTRAQQEGLDKSLRGHMLSVSEQCLVLPFFSFLSRGPCLSRAASVPTSVPPASLGCCAPCAPPLLHTDSHTVQTQVAFIWPARPNAGAAASMRQVSLQPALLACCQIALCSMGRTYTSLSSILAPLTSLCPSPHFCGETLSRDFSLVVLQSPFGFWLSSSVMGCRLDLFSSHLYPFAFSLPFPIAILNATLPQPSPSISDFRRKAFF